ncbi:MAG: CoA transferase, partial [Chloroflexota bacterium]
MSIYDVESCAALKGIKVLDLGQSAVAQLVTKYLADHGATAIWIESMTHVDITRASHPHFGGIVHPNRAAASAASLTSRFSFGV